jgi:hypothetical protein
MNPMFILPQPKADPPSPLVVGESVQSPVADLFVAEPSSFVYIV